MSVIRRLASLAAVAAVVASPFSGGAPSGGATDVNPLALSFVSASRGYALGEVACGTGSWCATLSRTGDAGRTWTTARLPAGVGRLPGPAPFPGVGVLGVAFADPRDGWVYGWAPAATRAGGAAGLWSTHDGGRTWHRVDLAAIGVRTPVLALAAAHDRAYLIGGRLDQRYGLWTTPAGDDAWRRVPGVTWLPPAGGAQVTGAIVLRGRVGWALVGNDRGVTGASRLLAAGRWVPWGAPCAAVGDSYVVPTALSARALEVVCSIGGFGGYSAHAPPGARLGDPWLYASTDGGARFVPVRRLGLAPPTLLGSVSPVLLTRTTVVVVSESGNAVALRESRDGGARFAVVYRVGRDAAIGAVDVASARVAVAIVQSGRGAYLVRSADGGRTWSRSSL